MFFVLFQQVVHVKLMYDKESNRMRGKHVETFKTHISYLLASCISPLSNARNFKLLFSLKIGLLYLWLIYPKVERINNLRCWSHKKCLWDKILSQIFSICKIKWNT